MQVGGPSLTFRKKYRTDNRLTRPYYIFQPEMNLEIQVHNDSQTTVDKEICDLLATTIDSELTEAESKIWHAHPVWFLDGNPIVGYRKLKDSVRLLF